jgi:hypothetical protein
MGRIHAPPFGRALGHHGSARLASPPAIATARLNLAATLLAETIAAHGGIDRWERVNELRLRIRIGGTILLSRLASPRTHAFDVDIDTHRVRATIRPFPRPGLSGTFEDGSVRIETDSKAIVAERRIARGPTGAPERRLIWDDLDVLYFFGYAIWGYAVTPYLFLWQGFDAREGAAWLEPNGVRWRRLLVTYPSSSPTHSRQQTLYFDKRGWLQRLDYTAEILGRMARAVHYCSAHQVFDGLVFPTHRVVWWRRPSGQPLRLLNVMEGWVDHVTTVS